MTNQEAFKKAHALTRATLRSGDDYRVTFGACLKHVKAEAKRAEVEPAVTLEWFASVAGEIALFAIAVTIAAFAPLILVSELLGSNSALVAAAVALVAFVALSVDCVRDELNIARLGL